MIHFTGSDRYCLDKNYAGVLIIWDRMFGTFEWYRPNESLSYGLVDQPQFFNPLKHQVPTKSIYAGFLMLLKVILVLFNARLQCQPNIEYDLLFPAFLHETCF